MTGIVANLLVNIFIAVLLMLTIGYCWVLNRRIKILQDSKSELAQLLRHFDESTQRASESIIALQTASKKIGENIQMRIEKANYMLDDLAFMIEKGNKVADKIEAGFAVQRASHRVAVEAPAAAETEARTPVMEKPAPKLQEKSAYNRERTAASLEAVLERVVGRSKHPQGGEDEGRTAGRQARSKSEQELLDMIKAGMKG